MKKGTLSLLSVVMGSALGATAAYKMKDKEIKKKQQSVDKFRLYYDMLNQWLMLKQEGNSLVRYFVDHNYKSIAIYGMGEMGNRLLDELANSEIEIKYAVDQNVMTIHTDLTIVNKDEELEDVDVMVVTAVFAYEEVRAELEGKVDFPIISLNDVVCEA